MDFQAFIWGSNLFSIYCIPVYKWEKKNKNKNKNKKLIV